MPGQCDHLQPPGVADRKRQTGPRLRYWLGVAGQSQYPVGIGENIQTRLTGDAPLFAQQAGLDPRHANLGFQFQATIHISRTGPRRNINRGFGFYSEAKVKGLFCFERKIPANRIVTVACALLGIRKPFDLTACPEFLRQRLALEA